MDSAVRRSFWNLLKQEKKGRHILLTTHSSQEADSLADQIGFMADGELKCCGSSVFLRKRFGNYRLVCVKKDDCRSSTTTKFLDSYFPGITIETETESQFSYVLSCDRAYKFGRVFERFETLYGPQMKLKSFSISIVTTEAAFRQFNKNLETDESPTNSFQNEGNSDSSCLCGIVLIPFQIFAILEKRFLCGVRDWLSFLLYNMIVIILLVPIVFDLNLHYVMNRRNVPPLDLSMDTYKNSYCFFEHNDKIPSLPSQQLSIEVQNK